MKNASLFSPQTIEQKEFKKTVWGYSPVEVVDYLSQVAKDVEKMVGKEKKLIEEIKLLTQEVANLKDKEREVATLKEKSLRECEAIQRQAVQEAELLMVETKKEIEEMRNKTEVWLQTVIDEVKATEEMRKTFLASLKESIQAHHALITQEELKHPIKLTLDQYLKELRPQMRKSFEPRA